MKKFLLFTLLLNLSIYGFTQQTIEASLTHDDKNREYILYIPEIYTGNSAVPLLLNFHGYTSTAAEQMKHGDFRDIADTAGFIIVHPQGTKHLGNTHWNVGGWTIGSKADDIGFTEVLLDSIANEYNIDWNRIYSTGMSNGGFMSFLLACQLSDKIAAIASVTGSMTPETFSDCNPQHPTPVLQIHGNNDRVVPYDGDIWTKAINDVLEYWINYNGCNTNPIITNIPDINTDDNSTAEHFIYDNDINGINTEHFKISGGDHTWPGNTFSTIGTNHDINASVEIWKFLSQYDINGLIKPLSIKLTAHKNIKIYPNPTIANITIQGEFRKSVNYNIINLLGESVQSGTINSNKYQINLSELVPNMYFLKIDNKSYKILKVE